MNTDSAEQLVDENAYPPHLEEVTVPDPGPGPYTRAELERRRELNEALAAAGDTDPDTFAGAAAGVEVEHVYAEAVEEYLGAATWVGALDRPFVVQARSIAKSLDAQLEETGQVQSALASTFDKVLVRLEARRPPATPPALDPAADGPEGTVSIFTQLR